MTKPKIAASGLGLLLVCGFFVATAKAQSQSNEASPLSTPSTTLWIGDSHSVGIFGDLLYPLLANRSATFAYANCGSGIQHWVRGLTTTCGYRERSEKQDRKLAKAATPLLQALLKKHQPDLLIIQLGTNDAVARLNALPADFQAMMNLLRSEFQGTRCFWVGPPPLRKNPEQLVQFQEALEKQFEGANSPCTLIPSVALLPSPTKAQQPDGIHYSGAAGKTVAVQWAELIATQIYPPAR